MHLYNEHTPYRAAVLRERIAEGRLPQGIVDERDIETIPDKEFLGYEQIHLFAGIGGFPLGFHQANFPINARIVTAGVPCQDVSVAGKRAGLAGKRTGLFYEFARVLRVVRPDWFVFENVPGLFSSNRGRDFAEILRVLMVECGYGLAWRVLNSQFFGVAQRRRRVFIVGRFGKSCPAEVLFEREGGARDSAESGETRPRTSRRADESIAGALAKRDWKGADNIYAEDGKLVASALRIAAPLTKGSGVTSNNPGRRHEDDFNIVIEQNTQCSTPRLPSQRSHGTPNYAVCTALRHLDRGGADDNEAQGGHIVIQDVRGGTRDKTDSGQGIGIREGGPSYTLGSTEQRAVAFTERSGTLHAKKNSGGWSPNAEGADDGALVSAPPDADGVRDFTGLPKGLDSARYQALGDAVTVSVIEWIARRIAAVCES